MIEIRSVSKHFGALQAVADVSLVAKNGHVTGILGPNGAGKTTTIRMLATLLRPDTGTISVDGISDPLRMRKQLGVVPHSGGLYPRLTAREHVRYFAELQGSALSHEDELIERLGMRDIADRRVAGFSQGEKLKVSLARALVHQPSHIVLDEPTNGLDVMSTRAVRELIRGFRDEGKCVVFSSHVMQEVSALCDHIVVIQKGRVVAVGSPAELKALAHTENLEDAFVELVK